MDIWAACRDAVAPRKLAGELLRMVESQEQIATHSLVDSLEEQSLLEDLLESSKPPAPAETARLHYLLATPFRYPPLKHGSRFGRRDEPSLFYAARDLSAALAETAYYRFVFWYGMVEPPPAGRLTTALTAFGARYSVEQGVCLHDAPFLEHEACLTNPQAYSDTQALGSQLRDAGIEAFEYRSARDPERGINIALFHARSFSYPKPVWQEPWICEVSAEKVSFYCKGYGTRLYWREQFLVDDELPAPSV